MQELNVDPGQLIEKRQNSATTPERHPNFGLLLLRDVGELRPAISFDRQVASWVPMLRGGARARGLAAFTGYDAQGAAHEVRPGELSKLAQEAVTLVHEGDRLVTCSGVHLLSISIQAPKMQVLCSPNGLWQPSRDRSTTALKRNQG